MVMKKYIETAIILDTNPGFRNDVGAFLKSQGIELLRSTANGKQGYQEIAKSKVRCDLVIANIGLEDITAIQFMSALRKNNRFSKTHVVIGLTNDLLVNVEDALSFGLSGFFNKPVSIEDLGNYLQEIFGIFEAYNGNALSVYNLAAAKFFEQQKSHKNAISYLEETLKLGDNPQVQFYLGKNKAFAKDKEGAQQAFAKALALNPKLKKPIEAFVASVGLGRDEEDARALSKSAMELFGLPMERLNIPFFGHERIRHAMVVSNSFDEKANIRNMLAAINVPQVSTHSKGSDAYAEMKSKAIDLVVLAIQLEDMNGLQLVDIIRRDTEMNHTRLVLLLEQKFTSNLEKAYQLGLDGFFLKPYSANALREALHHALLEDALCRVSEPKAQRLVKASLGYHRLKQYQKGLELAEAALPLDTKSGIAPFAKSRNLQGLGEEELLRKQAAEGARATEEAHQLAEQVEAPFDAPATLVRRMDDDEDSYEITPSAALEKSEGYEIESEETVDLGDFSLDGKAALKGEHNLTVNDAINLAVEETLESSEDSDDFEDEILPPEPVSQAAAAKGGKTYQMETAQPKTPVKSNEIPIDLFGSSRTAKAPPSEDVPEVFIDDSLFAVDQSALRRKEPEIDLNSSLQLTEQDEEAATILATAAAAVPIPTAASATFYRNPQALPKEEVFSAGAKPTFNAPGAGGKIIQTEGPTVRSWVPPLVLQNKPIPEIEKVIAGPVINMGSAPVSQTAVWHDEMSPFSHSFRTLVEQAQLFSGRIIVQPDAGEKPAVSLTDYLAKVGKIVMQQQSEGRLVNPEQRPDATIEKLKKQAAKNQDNMEILANLGRAYMENGTVDKLFNTVHAHWSMAEEMKSGNPSEIAKHAVNAGSGEKMLHFAITKGMGDKLLREIVKSGAGMAVLQAALETGAGLKALDKHLVEHGGIKFLEKEIKSGRGVRFLEDVVTSGGGMRFIADIFDSGGAAKILQATLQSPGAMKLLGETIQQGGGIRFIDDQIKPFTAALIELREPITKLHQEFWQNRESSEQILEGALQKMQEGAPVKDVKVFNEALAEDNFSLEAFKNIYNKLRAADAADLADKFYKSNAPLYMDKPQMSAALGASLAAAGDDQKAYKALQQAHKADQGNYEGLRQLAVTSLKMGKYRETAKWCKKMLRIQPNNAEAYNLLGINCKKHKKYKKSIGFYLKGIKADPTCLKLYHNLAIAYAQTGQERLSQRMMKRAQAVKEGRAPENDVEDLKKAS